MEWWHYLLIGLASAVVGVFLGALVDRLVKRFAQKRGPSLLFEQQVEEQSKYTPPDLVDEIESNRKIAAEPWAGKLLSFQTGMWDARQDEVNKLPANLREDLAQVYIDIRLANSIVRLSTEFSHRTQNLDEHYIKLRTNIAQRLDRIKRLMERREE